MRGLIRRFLLAGGLALLAAGPGASGQPRPAPAPAFTVVPLGVQGGLAEGNLSAYLVAPAGSTDFVCLDAGSLRTGLEKAVANHALGPSADAVLKHGIKGYCLSHAHLDHVAGLLLNAPDDAPKRLYGLADCLATMQNDYFNWRAWPNFGSAGPPPSLRKYQLQALTPGQETPIENTRLHVRPFVLSHGNPAQSAAFLVRSQDSYLLYLGDTGADEVEQTHQLRSLWEAVQPLVQRGQLKALFIETSYENAQPRPQLFGHLTPALLMQEMAALAQLTGPTALRGLPVVITHIKPSAGNEAAIRQQLAAANTLHLQLIFPVQGEPLAF